jgi:hypothetical protein
MAGPAAIRCRFIHSNRASPNSPPDSWWFGIGSRPRFGLSGLERDRACGRSAGAIRSALDSTARN